MRSRASVLNAMDLAAICLPFFDSPQEHKEENGERRTESGL
jgi:hypothetical protein